MQIIGAGHRADRVRFPIIVQFGEQFLCNTRQRFFFSQNIVKPPGKTLQNEYPKCFLAFRFRKMFV